MKVLIVKILLLAVVGRNQVYGHPQDHRVGTGEDTHVTGGIKSVYEDSVAAASEDSYDDHDDSDMFMEPDGAESAPSPKAKSEAPTEIVAVMPVKTTIHVTSSESTADPASAGTQAHAEKSEDRQPESGGKSLETDSQNFFPSFAELFGGNHRSGYTDHQQQQQRYRPSRFLGYYHRDRPFQASASAKESTATILGSGNFGVIQGGTYYPEDRTAEEYASSDDHGDFPAYFRPSNRGRQANYYKNPKPQPVRGGDFFANFRDFADITAPKSSFSHLSVVYANKHGATRSGVEQPRNIFETLRMLEEQEQEQDELVMGSTSTTTELPTKKPSQGKRKLAKWKKYQEEKARKSRVAVEPLIALS